MGKKRGVPLPDADGSETSFAMPLQNSGAVELSDNVSPFRGDEEDARSLASEASELALAPKKAGVVGVRTSIGPAKEGAAGSKSRSYSGGLSGLSGVQVQKEVYQTSTTLR
jgi:hypothetical protein